MQRAARAWRAEAAATASRRAGRPRTRSECASRRQAAASAAAQASPGPPARPAPPPAAATAAPASQRRVPDRRTGRPMRAASLSQPQPRCASARPACARWPAAGRATSGPTPSPSRQVRAQLMKPQCPSLRPAAGTCIARAARVSGRPCRPLTPLRAMTRAGARPSVASALAPRHGIPLGSQPRSEGFDRVGRIRGELGLNTAEYGRIRNWNCPRRAPPNAPLPRGFLRALPETLLHARARSFAVCGGSAARRGGVVGCADRKSGRDT